MTQQPRRLNKWIEDTEYDISGKSKQELIANFTEWVDQVLSGIDEKTYPNHKINKIELNSTGDDDSNHLRLEIFFEYDESENDLKAAEKQKQQALQNAKNTLRTYYASAPELYVAVLKEQRSKETIS